MVVRTGQQLQQIAAIYKSDWLQAHILKKKSAIRVVLFLVRHPQRARKRARERERERELY
jgi:hypothetical protein